MNDADLTRSAAPFAASPTPGGAEPARFRAAEIVGDSTIASARPSEAMTSHTPGTPAKVTRSSVRDSRRAASGPTASAASANGASAMISVLVFSTSLLVSGARSLRVVLEFDHVAVLYDVLLALDPKFSDLLRLRDAPELDEVLVANDVCLDESLLDVGVDRARGALCRRASGD